MKKEENKILIVDDDPRICWMLNEALKDESYKILTARDGRSALRTVVEENPQVMVLDIKLPDISGLEVLEKVREAELKVEVIILSAHGETKNVVQAIKLGAADFVNKPFDIEEVKMHIRNTLEKGELKKEVQYLRSELKAKNWFESFIGDSPKVTEIKKVVEEVADSSLTVLIRGESGTGKEIVARILHHISSRKDGPFIKVNCVAIPKELLEAELFGYERGAFTGAYKRKPGRFELANQGTIFLDEIGDIGAAGVRQSRRGREHLRGCEDHLCHKPGSGEELSQGKYEGGSLLSTKRDNHFPSPSPGTEGGHPTLGRTFP